MRLGNTSGFVLSKEPTILVGPSETGATVVRFLTLYNPNRQPIPFMLQYAGMDSEARRLVVRRIPGWIDPLKPWIFGENGAVMIVPQDRQLELVLQATPEEAIEWSVDQAESA